MKILNVSYTLDDITGGGVAERATQLSKYLNLFGAECHTLTINTGTVEARKKLLKGSRFTALECLFKRFYVPKTSYASIRKMVAECDIVHMMGHWTILNILIYLAARAENKPYIICPAGSLQIYGRSKLFKKIYSWVVGKAMIQNATFCIAITQDEIKHFAPYNIDHKVVVIPNGISRSDFESNEPSAFRKKFNLSDRPFILFLGRLSQIKGPDLLLQAFSRVKDHFPNFDLVFAGPNDGLLPALTQMQDELQLNSRTFFIGHVSGIDKSNAYHTAEVLAIPSRQEAMSIVALESGICQTPVLLTDQCGFDQLSEIGGGWVVPATVDGLEKGLIQALADESIRQSSGKKIKDYVLNNFTWEIIVKHYFSLFSKIKY